MNLMSHAIRKVWQAPRQDKQVVLKSKLVSKDSLSNFLLQRELFLLPNRSQRFVVYQVGVVNQELLNLAGLNNRWVNGDDWCTEKNMQVYAYNEFGDTIPLHQLYFRILRTGNMVIASTKIGFKGPVYFRFYSNLYLSDRGEVNTFGMTIKRDDDKIAFQTKLLGLDSSNVLQFRNGRLVTDFGSVSIEGGDEVSYIEDPSIDHMLDFHIKDLGTFKSALDGNDKFLLHPHFDDQVINYQDDLELFLMDSKEPLGMGMYISRSKPSNLRQITHTDWGVDYSLIRELVGDRDINDFYIRVFVRVSNDGDKLTHEFNRIKELYKFTHNEIESIMLSKVSTLEMWTAGELEVSEYARLLRTPYSRLTMDLVYKAYGYSASSYYTSYNHYKVESGAARLCEQMSFNSTVYEYSDVGNYLGSHYHLNGEYYVPKNSLCTQIQVYSGKAGAFLNYSTSDEPEQLNPSVGYRFFTVAKPYSPGVSEITEVTGDDTKYRIVDHNVEWLVDTDGILGIVVSDDYFFQKDYLVTNDDLYHIPINSDFEFETVEVWLNNKPLIENIDFTYVGLAVSVRNVKWVKDNNVVTVRGSGIKTEDPKFDVKLNTGFIVNGKMMVDDSHELVENKILKCIVGGKVMDVAELNWETHTTLTIDNSMDGQPYSVREVLAPVRGVKDYDPYYLRELSKSQDAKVINFNNVHKDIEDQPSAIVSRHELYSVVLYKVMQDIKKYGRLILEPHQDVPELDLWMNQYDNLRDIDVTLGKIDLRYVRIMPGPMVDEYELTEAEYNFLQRINKTYLNGLVELSGHVKIVAE